jgi:diguanylate cyclase (GGDEF)-like protein/PAS domain S-box-containing protein
VGQPWHREARNSLNQKITPDSVTQRSTRSIYRSPGGFLTTDNSGTILEVKPEAAVLLHTSLQRLPGKSLSAFIHARHQENFKYLLTLLTEPDLAYEWEAVLHLRNGKTIPASFEISTHLTSAKQLELHWFIRDISEQAGVRHARDRIHTELERQFQNRTNELIQLNEKLAFETGGRKRAEEALRQAREELESRVTERTTELAVANERLQTELTERKRAEAAAAQRAREFGALHTATAVLLSTLELEPLLGQILDAATSAIPAAEKGTLHLIAKDTGQLEMRAFIGYTDPRIRKFANPGSRGYVVKAVQNQVPQLIHDVQTDPLVRYEGQIPEVRAIRSAVVAPLLLEQEVLGALSLEASAKSAFTTDDLRVLVSFAATATAAIRNAQLHAEVQKLAITDVLTGLYNRRGFFELGRHEVERTRRFRHPLSTVWLDVDNFKHINDTYGHHIGDRVLKAVAECLNTNTRDVDILGRYGGDEFAILLPETDLSVAKAVAERLRLQVTKTSVTVNGTPVDVSVSIGVSKATEEINGLETLLKRADAAMYAAKQAGGNCVKVESV